MSCGGERVHDSSDWDLVRGFVVVVVVVVNEDDEVGAVSAYQITSGSCKDIAVWSL